MRTVMILGSTGSIGTQALDVIRNNPERFRVVGLSAHSRSRLLFAQAQEFGVTEAALVCEPDELPPGLNLRTGELAATQLVEQVACDVVLNGITGSVGLRPTLATLRQGATLALANKESLIVGGSLVKRLAADGQIVPVDSEHSAIAQCLVSGQRREVDRLIVTASGGPFRGMSEQQLSTVTPEQALAHPTWDMGKVVTTNSATLVNKGLEVIEAHLLFDIPFHRIDVVVHPQSIVHSMVQFTDGSTIAQVSPPDMRLPISLGLGWPERVAGTVTPYDWSSPSSWEFEPLDDRVFPAVTIARRVGEAATTYPAVFNAANEEAVVAFHARRISFPHIVHVIEETLERHTPLTTQELTLETVFDAERWARETANQVIDSLASRT